MEKKCAPFTSGQCCELVGKSYPHLLLFTLFGLDILEMLPDRFFLRSTDEAKEMVDAAYKYERNRWVLIVLSLLGAQLYPKNGEKIIIWGVFLLFKYLFYMEPSEFRASEPFSLHGFHSCTNLFPSQWHGPSPLPFGITQYCYGNYSNCLQCKKRLGKYPYFSFFQYRSAYGNKEIQHYMTS